MGYSGLVSREHSSGNRIQRGAITKTGNAHLRRVLVEAAWAYQHRPNVTGYLLRRQKSLALSEEVKQIAWKAQHRLHKRYQAFAARGKNKNQIVTALGRELLGFVWAIAVHTEAQHQPGTGSLNRDVSLDSSADDSAGPTKRRTLLTFYAERSPAQPAPLVRGSSRRIMSMRFRPANIRVINRRVCSSAVICPAVQTKKAGLPLCRGKPASTSNSSDSGLDRSLHIRT